MILPFSLGIMSYCRQMQATSELTSPYGSRRQSPRGMQSGCSDDEEVPELGSRARLSETVSSLRQLDLSLIDHD